MLQRVRVSQISVGGSFTLSAPIFDNAGTKLIGAGVTLTQKMVDRLMERGINLIMVDETDFKKLGVKADEEDPADNSTKTKLTKAAPSNASSTDASSTDGSSTDGSSTDDTASAQDAAAEHAIDHAVNQALHETAFLSRVKRHGNAPYAQESVGRFQSEVKNHYSDLAKVWSQIGSGEPSSCDLETLIDVSKGMLGQVAEDMDLFVALGQNAADATNFALHSLRVARMATSIGVTLGLDETALSELQIGCLVHDISMPKVRHNACQHTAHSSQLREIVDHPAMSLKVCQQEWAETPIRSLFIAGQMHERCDGSGYPRGRTGDKIDDLAKIAAVADMFIALASAHPMRAPLLPHASIRSILQDTSRGLFDSDVTRALLQTVSIYPIASFVALSDGRMAQVIRSNGIQYCKPVVEICEGYSDSAEPVTVNLLEEPELEIKMALRGPQLEAAPS